MARQFTQKLCVPRLVDSLYAAYDDKGKFILDNVDVGGISLKPKYQKCSPSFLLGLLNSRLMRWFFPFVSAPFRGGWLSANKQFLSKLPIILPTHNDLTKFNSIVNQILVAKQANPTADVSALEQEIDQLVYALYGLTPAEIALVEGREVALASSGQAEGEGALEARATAGATVFTGQAPQGSFSEKTKRIEQLSKQATPAALQDLAAALADDNATIRWQAAAALKSSGGAQAAGALQAFIAHTENTAAKAEAEKLLKNF